MPLASTPPLTRLRHSLHVGRQRGGPGAMPGVGGGGPREGPPALYWAGPHPAHPLGGGGCLQPKATHLGIAPRGWQETGQRWDVPRCATGSTALCHGQGWAVARCAMGRAGMCHGQHRAVPRCAMSSPWGHRMGSAGAIPWAALGPCHRRCWAYATPCHRQHSSHTMRGIGAIP